MDSLDPWTIINYLQETFYGVCEGVSIQISSLNHIDLSSMLSKFYDLAQISWEVVRSNFSFLYNYILTFISTQFEYYHGQNISIFSPKIFLKKLLISVSDQLKYWAELLWIVLPNKLKKPENGYVDF